MVRRIVLFLCAVGLAFIATAEAVDLGRLEKVLHDRPEYVRAREERIDSLKREMDSARSLEDKLGYYDALYDEYLTFRFDSAVAYLDRAEMLLGADASYAELSKIKIHRALSLATAGHFSEAVDLLRTVDSRLLPEAMRAEFYSTYQWTYGVWAEYSGHVPFADEYRLKSMLYLDSLLDMPSPTAAVAGYHRGESAMRRKDFKKARDCYERTLKLTPIDTRLYAQAAYGQAMAYKALGMSDSSRHWMVNAAISDQIIPLKENLALQELALDIKNTDGDLETANRYLKYSLEDAMFYNNRLRMLEISEKFPDIVLGYQDTITAQNRRLKIYVLCIGVLVIGLMAAGCVIVSEQRKLNASRRTLSQLNEQLKELNDRLARTNISRERYVSLFMDLCAAYIDKLNRFQTTVVTKLKARQFDDLLRVANSNARPSEAEMRELFFNFDTAFLRLYPDFIARFNSLLQPDKVIVPRQNELLNTDLRIYALIRMGISDSSKIATLLFYSPQTIFNHRTQVRNRAKDRVRFESQLMEICSVLPETNP